MFDKSSHQRVKRRPGKAKGEGDSLASGPPGEGHISASKTVLVAAGKVLTRAKVNIGYCRRHPLPALAPARDDDKTHEDIVHPTGIVTQRDLRANEAAAVALRTHAHDSLAVAVEQPRRLERAKQPLVSVMNFWHDSWRRSKSKGTHIIADNRHEVEGRQALH